MFEINIFALLNVDVFVLIFQTIYHSSPTSAGAECIDPGCNWVEQW
jgi:hypothetical protein